MTFGGWIVMLASVTAVTALCAWCFYKVLKTPGETERLHAFEFETPDEKAEREEEERNR